MKRHQLNSRLSPPDEIGESTAVRADRRWHSRPPGLWLLSPFLLLRISLGFAINNPNPMTTYFAYVLKSSIARASRGLTACTTAITPVYADRHHFRIPV